MTIPTHAFVATRPCGCAIWVGADLGDSDTAEAVRAQLRDGLTVRYVTLDEAQATRLNYDCAHTTEPQRFDADGLLIDRSGEAAWEEEQQRLREMAAAVAEWQDARLQATYARAAYYPHIPAPIQARLDRAEERLFTLSVPTGTPAS